MVVQTRFFSCRFSISHAKQRPTTAPRRAARVRATAFPARPWSDAWLTQMLGETLRRHHAEAPLAIKRR
jgi:hypothetical protein